MIYSLVSMLIKFFETAIVLNAVLSWFPIQGFYEVKGFLSRIVDPILEPIQKLLYRYVNLGNIDISPIVALIILSSLRRLLFYLLW